MQYKTDVPRGYAVTARILEFAWTQLAPPHRAVGHYKTQSFPLSLSMFSPSQAAPKHIICSFLPTGFCAEEVWREQQ